MTRSVRPVGRVSGGGGGLTLIVVAGVFVVLALGTLVLGVWSLLVSRGSFDPPLGFFDVVGALIGLYTNEPPDWERQGVTMPQAYDIAKVLGPVTAAYAFVSTAAVLLTTQLQLLRARLARRHSIVCGGQSTGVALARALAEQSVTVLVDADAGSAGTSASLVRRAIAISGDPRDSLVLRRAGVWRASEVFALADADDVNASITLAALASARGRREKLACYALVDDLMLHLTLQAQVLTTDGNATLGLNLLDRHQLYASAIVAREPPDSAITVMVGSGDTARALAMELTRHLYAHSRSGHRASLLLVGEDTSATSDVIASRWEVAAGRIEVVARGPADAAAALTRLRNAEPGGVRVFVSESEGDRRTLASGLTWLHQIPGLDRLVLCMNGESGLTSSFSRHADELFAGSGGILGVYSPVIALSDPMHIRNQTFQERMARRLHAIYLAEVATGESPDPGSAAAVKPWSELPETFKDSNRDQAMGLGRKITSLGMTIVPIGATSSRLSLTPAQVETLAEMEHERWMAERLRHGFTLGPQRTETHHPDLVPWTSLGEPAREKDRVFIRRIPDLLLAEGLEVVANPMVSPAVVRT